VCKVTYPAATLRLPVERTATSPLRALSHVTLPADMAASSVHAPPSDSDTATDMFALKAKATHAPLPLARSRTLSRSDVFSCELCQRGLGPDRATPARSSDAPPIAACAVSSVGLDKLSLLTSALSCPAKGHGRATADHKDPLNSTQAPFRKRWGDALITQAP
jgi:hypothetical protein